MTIVDMWQQQMNYNSSIYISTSQVMIANGCLDLIEDGLELLDLIITMAIRKEIEAASSEWAHVDYQLQLVTGKSSIKLVSLFRLSDDLIPQQIFRTEAVINATDFGKDYIDRVRSKTVPLEDLMVFCGHVNIHAQSQTNKMFTFLIGRVALGRRGTARDDVTRLDSILIDPERDRNSCQFNFFLRSHDQYQLRYEANFTVGQQREYNPADYICVSCENKQASLYCRTERLYFCEGCSADHHRTKILQGHQVERIDKLNTLPLCKTHQQRYNSYCSRCEKYLCPGCIQKGGSHGGSDHPVYLIAQLYEEKREINQSLAIRQKERLENLLRSLQLKKQEVDQNFAEVGRYIQKQRERAALTLEQLAQEKSLLLSSDQLELRMLNEKLDWAKAFVKFQEKTLKPIYYFHSQQRFEKDLEKSKLGDFESIYNVKGDLAAEGEILVGKKDILERSRNKAPMTSRTEEREKDKESRISSPARLKQESLYEYNANAEIPQKGELCSLLETSQLNFFMLNK